MLRKYMNELMILLTKEEIELLVDHFETAGYISYDNQALWKLIRRLRELKDELAKPTNEPT